MLPIALVVVIVFLALIAIMQGRSNVPGVAGDDAYPHYVCSFNEYCEGDVCTTDPSSFVLYLEHIDLKPRLELARVNPDVTLTRDTPSEKVFETIGGQVRGTLMLFSDRSLHWAGLSGPSSAPIEHYASGSCQRLRTP